MKEKVLDFFNKVLAFFKKNRIAAISVAAAAAVIVVAVIVVLSFGGDSDNTSESKWGYGITESIPEFDGDCDRIDKSGSGYCVAYYSDVTGDEVSEYISELEEKCNITFNSDKYPRSAVYGDRIIAVHYNVTEKKFSVTVVSKNTENTESFGADQ